MLLTAGTRGDVEPFAALARYASARGHRVRLGLPLGSGVSLSGVDAVDLDSDVRAVVPPPGESAWSAARHLMTEVRPAMRRLLAAAVRETVAFSPDVVVHHPLILTAPMVADALGVPRVLVEFAPVATATAAFPAAGGPTATRDLGRYNRLSYAVPRAGALFFRSEVADAAAQLPSRRRPATRTRSHATLMAASPQLLHRPEDWPAKVHLTGLWREEQPADAVDPALADLMRDGGYLVASFGSMTAGDAGSRGRAVVEAARMHGLRVLLVTGWGGLIAPADPGPVEVVTRTSVPLAAVLPGAALAVHHGGAGTAHAVACAGIPSVVVPFTADQPFWAAQLHRRALAAAPIPYRRLSARTLVPAIAEATAHREHARRVGRLIQQEDGLGASLDVILSLRR